jgi:hypothetical protein
MKNLFFALLAVCCVVALPAQNRPGWTVRKPQDTAEMSYFTSVVDGYVSEEEALRSAINNVNSAVATSTMVYIRSSVSERSRTTESQAEFAINIEMDSYTDLILSGISIETYSEGYANPSGRQHYRAWALASISKAQTEENRRAYVAAIAQRYTLDAAVHRDSLSAALSVYSGIYNALLQNPLHRTIAVYGEGQNLFEYCRQKINEIATSILFEDIPPQSVRRGDTLTIPVRVSSPLFSNIAALECRASVQDGNRVVPGGSYTVGSDNFFVLRIPSSALEAGSYQVKLELNTFSPAITRNPGTNFRLEVRPATAQIRFEGETLSPVEGRVLSQAVEDALQRYGIHVLAGCEFVLTFDVRTQAAPFGAFSFLICDVSIRLSSAGTVLFRSASERITELSRDHALKLAADYIRNNGEFWTGVGKHLE